MKKVLEGPSSICAHCRITVNKNGHIRNIKKNVLNVNDKKYWISYALKHPFEGGSRCHQIAVLCNKLYGVNDELALEIHDICLKEGTSETPIDVSRKDFINLWNRTKKNPPKSQGKSKNIKT